MRNKTTLFLLLSFFYIGSNHLFAMNANPTPFQVKLSNGESIYVKLNGTFTQNWMTTVEGNYPVVFYTDKNGNKVLTYAVVDDFGKMVSSEIPVEQQGPPLFLNLKQNMEPDMPPPPPGLDINQGSNEERENFKSLISKIKTIQLGDADAKAPAVVKNFVLLMRFSDEAGHLNPTAKDFNYLFNKVGGKECMEKNPNCNCDRPVGRAYPGCIAPTGSVRDVYKVNSYDAIDLVSTVTRWVDVPTTRIAAAGGRSGLSSTIHTPIRQALDIIDKEIDFREFDQDGDGWIDAFTIVHSGYGAENGGLPGGNTNYIWSHKWAIPTWTSDEGIKISRYNINPGRWGRSGDEVSHIGVIAHEIGHFFGLPDLYSYSNEGAGIMDLGLMCNSWGVDGSQYYPPLMSAWSRYKLGWTETTTITSEGTYNLSGVHLRPQTYLLKHGYEGKEYLLIENRRPYSYDKLLPGGGMTVYHIDDAKSGQNGAWYPGKDPKNHYKVRVIQADGIYTLEKNRWGRIDKGDFFPYSSIQILNDSRNPTLNSYVNLSKNDGSCTGNIFENISSASNNMEFDYRIDKNCTDEPPTCFENPLTGSLSPRVITLTDGTTVMVNLTVKNNDSAECEDKTVKLIIDASPKLQFEAIDQMVLKPGEEKTIVLKASVDSSVYSETFDYLINSEGKRVTYGTIDVKRQRPCTPKDPSARSTNSNLVFNDNSSQELVVTVTNNDSKDCEKRIFSPSLASSSYVSNEPIPNFSLEPGVSKSLRINVNVNEEIKSATYNYDFKLGDKKMLSGKITVDRKDICLAKDPTITMDKLNLTFTDYEAQNLHVEIQNNDSEVCEKRKFTLSMRTDRRVSRVLQNEIYVEPGQGVEVPIQINSSRQRGTYRYTLFVNGDTTFDGQFTFNRKNKCLYKSIEYTWVNRTADLTQNSEGIIDMTIKNNNASCTVYLTPSLNGTSKHAKAEIKVNSVDIPAGEERTFKVYLQKINSKVSNKTTKIRFKLNRKKFTGYARY